MSEIRLLEDTDFEAYLNLRRVAFPGPGYDEPHIRKLLGKRMPYTTGFFEGGELAAAYSMYPMTYFFAGTTVTVGALGAVACMAEYRRRGKVRELLLHGLAQLNEQGVGWCLESPFDPHFYGRLGWQSLPWGRYLEMPTELLLTKLRPNTRRLPLEDLETVASIFESWASRFSFASTRRDDPRGSWSRITSKAWLDGDAFFYRFDEAYLLMTLERSDDRQIATVEDYAHATPEGRDSVLAFLGALHGQVDLIRIHVPQDDPLALQHGTRHQKPGGPHFQVRVADLAAALAPLRSESRRRLRLELRDEHCPWNDGEFLVEIGPDGTRVRRPEGDGHQASGDSPDPQPGPPLARMPVTTLPLLVTGAVSARAALAAGLACGDGEALDTLEELGRGQVTYMPSADNF